MSWLKRISSKLAIFGNNELGLVASFLLLVVALVISLLMDQPSDPYSKLGPAPKIDPPHIFVLDATNDEPTSHAIWAEMQSAFEKDGVIAVRGLLSSDLMDRLDEASTELIMKQNEKNNARWRGRRAQPSTQFHTVEVGTIFQRVAQPWSIEMYKSQPFVEIALFSKLPFIAANLLNLDVAQNETLRLLRDIFLAKDDGEFICGWHVDDSGFWPATAEAPGVNAWVAFDDMKSEQGGGFALAVGSHKATWREEAYVVTGSTHTTPPEGYRDVADLFSNRTGSGTCNIKTAAPHLHRRMEETKRVYEIKRGDVIFHTRWLFHRTVPFERATVFDSAVKREQLLHRRLSLRYGPGSSIIPRGYGTELSVLWDESNGGRRADEVDGPWYPKVWPNTSDHELSQIKSLIENKLPVATSKRDSRIKEMQPYRKLKNRQVH